MRFAFVFREMLVMSRSGIVVGLSLRRMRWRGQLLLCPRRVHHSRHCLASKRRAVHIRNDEPVLKYPSIAVNGWRRSCQAVQRGWS